MSMCLLAVVLHALAVRLVVLPPIPVVTSLVALVAMFQQMQLIVVIPVAQQVALVLDQEGVCR